MWKLWLNIACILVVFAIGIWQVPEILEIYAETLTPAPDPASAPAPQMAPPMFPEPWEAVARIDEKIANAIQFLLIVIALFPFLLAINERLRYRDLRDFDAKAMERADAVAAQLNDTQKEFLDAAQSTIRSEVAKEVRSVEDRYIEEISQMISRRISEETMRQTKFMDQREATAEIFLISYIKNDLATTDVHKQLESVFLVQQNLHRLSNLDERDIFTSIQNFKEMLKTMSKSTASFFLQHLETVREQGRIRSIDNIGHWDELVSRIETEFGVKRKETPD